MLLLLQGRFYFTGERVVPQVDQIISKAAMSLNVNYLICYLISPLSNYLANILMLFHLSNSWAKYFSRDTGNVFNLPWKLPEVVFEKDKAFNLEFFHLSHFRLHSHFLHLISAPLRRAHPFSQGKKH